MPERTNAAVNEAIGNVKSVAADVIGAIPGVDMSDMQKDGVEQANEGKAEYDAAQAEDKAKSVGNDVKGGVKQAVGSLVSDDLKQDGDEDRAKADAQDAKSQM